MLHNMTKHEILSTWQKKYADLAPQGSLEWLNNRQFTIGGSEVAQAAGGSKYGNSRSLIRSKLWPKQFNGFYMNWGTIFEDVTRSILNSMFRTTIYEFPSIPNEYVEHTSYSPDGIGLTYNNNDPSSDAYLTLFEIKSPSRRIPNGTIPVEYMMQIQHGMHTLMELDIAYFADGLYYKCSWNNLFDNEYDRTFNTYIPELNNVVALGIFGVYQYWPIDTSEIDDDEINEIEYSKPDEKDDGSEDEDNEFMLNIVCDAENTSSEIAIDDYINMVNENQELTVNENQELTVNENQELTVNENQEPTVNENQEPTVLTVPDLGLLNSDAFKHLFARLKNGIVKRWIADANKSPTEQLNDFLQFCSKYGVQPIGIVPWKLGVFHVVQVKRDTSYYNETMLPGIKKTINALIKCRDVSDPETELDKLYPTKRRTTRVSNFAENINDMMVRIVEGGDV